MPEAERAGIRGAIGPGDFFNLSDRAVYPGPAKTRSRVNRYYR
jgi:hypothetical protein